MMMILMMIKIMMMMIMMKMAKVSTKNCQPKHGTKLADLRYQPRSDSKVRYEQRSDSNTLFCEEKSHLQTKAFKCRQVEKGQTVELVQTVFKEKVSSIKSSKFTFFTPLSLLHRRQL